MSAPEGRSSSPDEGFDACPEPTCPLFGKAVMADHRHLDTPAARRRWDAEGRSSTAERSGPCRPWKNHEGACPTTLRPGCPHLEDHLGCLGMVGCVCPCHHGWFQWPVTDDARERTDG